MSRIIHKALLATLFSLIVVSGGKSSSDKSVRCDREDTPRPGEDNEGLPFKVQLQYGQTQRVGACNRTGRLTSKIHGNFPPFEIIHGQSDLEWNYHQRFWGGSFSGGTQKGGLGGRWLLSRTNGTIEAGIDGSKLGASPRVKLVQSIDGSVTFHLDGGGVNLDCAPATKGPGRWTCKRVS
ncbi:hypothetical protein V8E36_005041 [Tilletia maclaganii]